MNQVINEDLIPVREIIIPDKINKKYTFYFVNKNNKDIFQIESTKLGNNIYGNLEFLGSIFGKFQFNYSKNLIVFDSGDYSDTGKYLNTRLFILDFEGNILFDLKNHHMNSIWTFQNQPFIYFYKEFHLENSKYYRRLCFLKDDLSIVETSYSKFEKTVLNGFLVSRKNQNQEIEYALYSKDYELLIDTITSQELDLKFLLNIK